MALTLGYAAAARDRVSAVPDPWAESWCAEVDAYVALIERVVDQSRRRVFDGEKVPGAEKVVILFEPHTETPDRIPTRASTPFLRASTPFPGAGTWGHAPVGPDGAPQLFDLAPTRAPSGTSSTRNRGTVAELHGLLLASFEEYGAGDAVQALWRSPGSGTAGGSWARDYLER